MSTITRQQNMRQVWWQLTRPHTLTASFVPVLIGTILALFYHTIHAGLFLAMLAACLLIQIATNLFNEYYDFKRGLDTEASVGIGGAIVKGVLKPKTILNTALLMYGFSILLGVYICMNSSWWLALIGLLGMAVGYLYTGGPLPIAYTPFGEILAGLFMGSMFILISFFIQTGVVNRESVLISVPVAILVGAINMSNNIRDLEGDRDFGRKTLAILIGPKGAIMILAVMFLAAYLWVTGLIISGIVSPWLFLVLLSIKKPIDAVSGFIGKTSPKEMMGAMKATAQTNTFFGLLICAGLAISYFL
ncbi:1,4-dihydroxy-2-naphthoate polyprenyltransferase [Falsibacillus albus]|uniref:1,4-dihydroxy-2-naphthoate octaprenyltransferase n=1 Tax=Falsibacillus albus TaxID=2478915 RepID=A0A3L7JRA4_9BACI|nr:1,4-dihydroxy-2-naphthoate polyprenyltransferase [Falsibacillus albus]RLQ93358.1 1,4-dihydroxy-2-naphthoate polyprenyltransferase [Falsibacillus albus]